MASILLLVLLTVVFSRWTVEAAVVLLTPVFTLAWLPWLLLVLLLWLLAGAPGESADRPSGADERPRRS